MSYFHHTLLLLFLFLIVFVIMEKNDMIKKSIQKFWHNLFEFSVFMKGINGLWETLSGFSILFLNKTTLTRWFSFFIHKELLEDPRDRFISFLAHALQNFSTDTKIFIAFYMLLHGFLNIFLAIQLYRDRHWAYLVAIGTMSSFLVYQIYRISIHHSLILTAITIFDAFFIFLTWHEYKYHQDQLKK